MARNRTIARRSGNYHKQQGVAVVDSAFDFVPFTIQQSGSTFSVGNFNLRTHAGITPTTIYYLNTVTGSDGNDGLSTGAAKKTWNSVITAGNATAAAYRVIIEDGSYLIRSESSLSPTQNAEVIGEGTVYFTSDRSNNLGAWSLAADQTNTYQSTVAGGEFIARVFDEDTLNALENPTPLVSRASIALVEANPGSFFWSSGTLYVHTFDSTDPTGQTNLKYYDSSAVFWSKDNLKFYFENINFRGGVTFRNASAAGTATKAYIKNCTGHSLAASGVSEFIAQGCTFFTATADTANYDILNSVVPNIIEIDCEFYNSGASSTDQASTGHNGCKIVRVNGEYHDVTGQCAAEANATTKAWLLGSELYNSSVSNIGYFTQGESWLDGCNIHDVTTDLFVDTGATIHKRNLTSGGNFTNNGTLDDY